MSSSTTMKVSSAPPQELLMQGLVPQHDKNKQGRNSLHKPAPNVNPPVQSAAATSPAVPKSTGKHRPNATPSSHVTPQSHKKKQPHQPFRSVRPPRSLEPPRHLEPQRSLEPPQPLETQRLPGPQHSLEPPQHLEPQRSPGSQRSLEPPRPLEPQHSPGPHRSLEPPRPFEPQRSPGSQRSLEPPRKLNKKMQKVKTTTQNTTPTPPKTTLAKSIGIAQKTTPAKFIGPLQETTPVKSIGKQPKTTLAKSVWKPQKTTPAKSIWTQKSTRAMSIETPQETTPAKCIRTPLKITPAETIKTLQETTPAKFIGTSHKITLAKSIGTAQKTTLLRSVETPQETTPTKFIKTPQETTPAKFIKTPHKITLSKSIGTAQETTLAKSIGTAQKKTPLKSIGPLQETTSAKSIDLPQETTPAKSTEALQETTLGKSIGTLQKSPAKSIGTLQETTLTKSIGTAQKTSSAKSQVPQESPNSSATIQNSTPRRTNASTWSNSQSRFILQWTNSRSRSNSQWSNAQTMSNSRSRSISQWSNSQTLSNSRSRSNSQWSNSLTLSNSRSRSNSQWSNSQTLSNSRSRSNSQWSNCQSWSNMPHFSQFLPNMIPRIRNPGYDLDLMAEIVDDLRCQRNEWPEHEDHLICRDFVWGTCTRHYMDCDKVHVRVLRLMRKIIKFCRDYQNGFCRNPHCIYLHCTRYEERGFYNKGIVPRLLLQRYVRLDYTNPHLDHSLYGLPPFSFETYAEYIRARMHLWLRIRFAIYNRLNIFYGFHNINNCLSSPSSVPSPTCLVPSPPRLVPSPPYLMPSPSCPVPSPPHLVPSPSRLVSSPPRLVPSPPQIPSRSPDTQEICRKYIWGTCENNNIECRFKHIRTIPLIRRTIKFCVDYQNGRCNNTKCVYLHSSKEEEKLLLQRGVLPELLFDRYLDMECNNPRIDTLSPSVEDLSTDDQNNDRTTVTQEQTCLYAERPTQHFQNIGSQQNRVSMSNQFQENSTPQIHTPPTVDFASYQSEIFQNHNFVPSQAQHPKSPLSHSSVQSQNQCPLASQELEGFLRSGQIPWPGPSHVQYPLISQMRGPVYPMLSQVPSPDSLVSRMHNSVSSQFQHSDTSYLPIQFQNLAHTQMQSTSQIQQYPRNSHAFNMQAPPMSSPAQYPMLSYEGPNMSASVPLQVRDSFSEMQDHRSVQVPESLLPQIPPQNHMEHFLEPWFGNGTAPPTVQSPLPSQIQNSTPLLRPITNAFSQQISPNVSSDIHRLTPSQTQGSMLRQLPGLMPPPIPPQMHGPIASQRLFQTNMSAPMRSRMHVNHAPGGLPPFIQGPMQQLAPDVLPPHNQEPMQQHAPGHLPPQI